MEKKQFDELMAALTVIYKKLDKMERSQKSSTLIASDQHYIDEFRREIQKLV